MSIVYVPQVPSRFDSTLRMWIPVVNMQPAERFGEIRVMFPPDANRVEMPVMIEAMKEILKDYNSYDFIVAVGDPSLLAAAACLASRATHGFLRMLKWDRFSSSYIPVEIQL